MTRKPPSSNLTAAAILVDIGNTTTSLATWIGGKVRTPVSAPTGNFKAIAEALHTHAESMPKRKPSALVMASVVPESLRAMEDHVATLWDRTALIVGQSVSLPLDVTVKDPSAVGVDRICAAAAGYEKLESSCAVVDFGTAVTVDLVNDDGEFMGGAILPGVEMQLRSLHEHTAQLPLTKANVPKLSYGRDTSEAIQIGVVRGLAGAVRGIVEGYASELNRWPHVIGTGGSLKLMAPYCDFLDSAVDHLTLAGIGIAYQKHLAALGV